MNLLSIDASTKSTGIAYFVNGKLTKYDCFTASSTDLIKRIYKIVNSLKTFMLENKTDKIVLEEVIPKNNQDESHTSNLKTRKALMYLQAQINFMLHDNFSKVEIDYVYPSEWRAAIGIRTGRGIERATLKEADIQFVKDNYGITVNDDIADAICIGHSIINQENNILSWE